MNPRDIHPLDNPVWFALSTKQSALRMGDGNALRYQPAVGPFAAMADDSQDSQAALASLLAKDDYVLVLHQSQQPFHWVPGLSAERSTVLHQMVDTQAPASVDIAGIARLGASDRAEMVELAGKTQPGPFAERTPETGNYFGMRNEDGLIAMAGERMRLPGYTEISAVCVEARYRGKGYAARLMNVVRHAIAERGETAFLHVKVDNLGAIALYRRLGFEVRSTFDVYRVSGSRGI